MSATQSKASMKDIHAEIKRLGITPDNCNRPVDEIAREAFQQDDPFAFLTMWALAQKKKKREKEASEPAKATIPQGNSEVLSPDPDQNLIDRLTGAVSDLKQQRDKSRAAEQQRLWDTYRKVLLGKNPPSENDIEDLLDICGDLGITV